VKLLLDEGVPLRSAALLRDRGFQASHVLELEIQGATDQIILDFARLGEAAVVTLDSDFHRLLALASAVSPSVIRIRKEGLSHQTMADWIAQVVAAVGDDFEAGVAVSVDDSSIRVHRLPLSG